MEYIIVLTAAIAVIVSAGRSKYESAIKKSYEGGSQLISSETQKIVDAVKGIY